MPAVSVIVPTFNRTEFLRRAIDSVFAQTWTDWELVIADDGSDEETRSYLRSLPGHNVRTIWLTHSGNPAHVRNCAIAAARGDYLAFLDSDDLWAPGKLHAQIEALKASPDTDWSYCLYNHIDAMGKPHDVGREAPRHFPEGWVFEPLLKLELAVPMPTLFASRRLVNEIGAFDEEQRFGEFHDLCLRLALRSKTTVVREVLCFIRSHSGHYSADRISVQQSWMRLYEKMAAQVPSEQLRSYCEWMRSVTSLRLAWLQGNRGDHRAVWQTLAQARRFSWRYPGWWYGAMKAVIRPHVLTRW